MKQYVIVLLFCWNEMPFLHAQYDYKNPQKQFVVLSIYFTTGNIILFYNLYFFAYLQFCIAES